MSILKNKEIRTVLMILGFLGFLVLGSMIVEFNILDFLYFVAIIITMILFFYIKCHYCK